MNTHKIKHSDKRGAINFPIVPLHFEKNMKSAAGVSVNDIPMMAMSQAINDYCKGVGGKMKCYPTLENVAYQLSLFSI